MRKGFWFLRAIKFVIFLALFLLIGGMITMCLWNALIPHLFHGPVLTFWETIGLLLLSKILLGGFGKGFCGKGRGGMNRGEWKERMREKCKAKMQSKMENMSDEDKEKFKKKFKFEVE